jgi:hypothetical protein
MENEEMQQEITTPEVPDGEHQTPQETPEQETFQLKVNKQQRLCTREEVIALAQKGADYDRVKQQLEQSRKAVQQNRNIMDTLEDLADQEGVSMDGLLERMRLEKMKKDGLSDTEARERLLRQRLEQENRMLREQAGLAAPMRMGRDLEAFRQLYPQVELSGEILEGVMEDVRSGMSLTGAYQRYALAQKDAEIQKLQQQLLAQQQNKQNLSASPGSQMDSGGRRAKSEYDQFAEAFR